MFNLLKSIFKIPLQAFLLFLMWLAMILVLGAYDFASAVFNWDRVRSAEYQTTVATLAIFGLVVFITTLVRRAEKIREQDKTTLTKEGQIDNVATNLDTSDLHEYVYDENILRRIKTYKHEQELKRTKIMNRISAKNLYIYIQGTPEQKQKNRVCKILNNYDLKLSQRFIDANKAYLPATFVKITPGFMLSGVYKKQRRNIDIETPSNPVGVAVNDNWFGFLFPLVAVSIILSVGFQEKEVDWVPALLSIGYKVFSLLLQDLSARMYASKWNKATYVADVDLRRSLWFRYVDWKVNNHRTMNKPKEAEKWPTNTDSLQTTTAS